MQAGPHQTPSWKSSQELGDLFHIASSGETESRTVPSTARIRDLSQLYHLQLWRLSSVSAWSPLVQALESNPHHICASSTLCQPLLEGEKVNVFYFAVSNIRMVSPCIQCIFISTRWLQRLWSVLLEVIVHPLFLSVSRCCRGFSIHLAEEWPSRTIAFLCKYVRMVLIDQFKGEDLFWIADFAIALCFVINANFSNASKCIVDVLIANFAINQTIIWLPIDKIINPGEWVKCNLWLSGLRNKKSFICSIYFVVGISKSWLIDSSLHFLLLPTGGRIGLKDWLRCKCVYKKSSEICSLLGWKVLCKILP